MKRIIAFLLTVMLLCSMLAACGAEEKPEGTTQPQSAQDDGVTRVLLVGHSLGNDSLWLVPAVAQLQGIDNMVFGMLYHSGCRLYQHVQFAKTDAKEYDYRQYDLSKDTTWQIADSNGGYYNGGANDDTSYIDIAVSLKFALQQQDWDIVVLQGGVFEQAGNTSDCVLDTGNIQILMDYVNENDIDKTTKPEFAWHQTWGTPMDLSLTKETSRSHLKSAFTDSHDLFEGICSTLRDRISKEYTFAHIIPSGTAFWNARSSYKDDLGMYRDYGHATDFGRLVAAYTWLCTLTGQDITEMKIDTIAGHQLKKYDAKGMTLNETEKAILIEAVSNALEKPYEMTQSAYTEAPAQ